MVSTQDPIDPDGQGRDPDLALWMARYGPGLRAFFVRKVGPVEADDLVQEIFLNLQTRAVAEDVENIERYLFKIAHNVLASRRRYGAAREISHHVPLAEDFEPVDEASPERILVGKTEYARAVVAVRKLPPRTQAAFVYHRFGQMTYPAIAKRMGISVSAVRRLMTRALAHIAREMGKAP